MNANERDLGELLAKASKGLRSELKEMLEPEVKKFLVMRMEAMVEAREITNDAIEERQDGRKDS